MKEKKNSQHGAQWELLQVTQ